MFVPEADTHGRGGGGVFMKDMLVFPDHRGLLHSRCLDQSVASRHDSPIGSELTRSKCPQ